MKEAALQRLMEDVEDAISDRLFKGRRAPAKFAFGTTTADIRRMLAEKLGETVIRWERDEQ